MKVYKFYKQNCAPCYVLGRVLKTISIPSEIQIINVDVDLENNKQLVKNNNVDQVPTLLSDTGKKLIGIQSKLDLEKFLGIN